MSYAVRDREIDVEAARAANKAAALVAEQPPADDGDDVGLIPRRVTKAEIIYVTSQLAIMVETGITLSTALDGIVQNEQNPSLKRVLKDLKNSVEEGEDFSAALAKHPKHFDKTYRALIRASEATGSLAEMLDRIAGYLRKELETRGKVRAAMAYPTVMAVLAVSVTIFLLTYVMPKFTPLFERKSMKLPKPTLVMMTVSHALINYWYFWLAGIIVIVAAFLFGKRTEWGRRAWDGFKLSVPIVGPMLKKVVISRSLRTLGTMVGSGVSMLDALQLSADVAGNFHYEQLWLKVLDEVTSGNQIHTALAGNDLFPPTLVQMMRSGEETGKLDVVLDRVSTYYDQEVETSLKTCTSLIEPLMITVMGAVVGGIGLSLLLPIFSLSRAH